MSNSHKISLRDLKKEEFEQLQHLLNKYKGYDKLDFLIMMVRGDI